MALALAEVQMCPAPARGKWPGHSKHLSGVHETERQHRAPRTHGRDEVLTMVLERKIRTVEEVSFETSSANLDLKGNKSVGIIQSLLPEHGIYTGGIISRNFTWWETYSIFLCLDGSDFC